jgi:hypothetical protein
MTYRTASELRSLCGSVTGKVYLREVPLTRDGYTFRGEGSVYFGIGPRLFYMIDADNEYREEYFRAADREDALERARTIYPQGKFRY